MVALCCYLIHTHHQLDHPWEVLAVLASYSSCLFAPGSLGLPLEWQWSQTDEKFASSHHTVTMICMFISFTVHTNL